MFSRNISVSISLEKAKLNQWSVMEDNILSVSARNLSSASIQTPVLTKYRMSFPGPPPNKSSSKSTQKYGPGKYRPIAPAPPTSTKESSVIADSSSKPQLPVHIPVDRSSRKSRAKDLGARQKTEFAVHVIDSKSEHEQRSNTPIEFSDETECSKLPLSEIRLAECTTTISACFRLQKSGSRLYRLTDSDCDMLVSKLQAQEACVRQIINNIRSRKLDKRPICMRSDCSLVRGNELVMSPFSTKPEVAGDPLLLSCKYSV